MAAAAACGEAKSRTSGTRHRVNTGRRRWIRIVLDRCGGRALLALRAPRRRGAGSRQGQLRHQLARRGRAWRLLPGRRRRHLREVRPRRHHRAGRPAGGQRSAADRRQDRLLHGRHSSRLFDDVKQGIPMVNVAAMFQKDPQILMAHPGVGIDTFADLAKADTIFIGKDVFATYFEWMKADFPASTTSSTSPTPSTRRRSSPTRCRPSRATSPPSRCAVKKAGGFKPNVFLFADNGYAHLLDARSRPRSEHGRRTSRTSCSASSMPRSSAGTTISTATTKRPTS